MIDSYENLIDLLDLGVYLPTEPERIASYLDAYLRSKEYRHMLDDDTELSLEKYKKELFVIGRDLKNAVRGRRRQSDLASEITTPTALELLYQTIPHCINVEEREDAVLKFAWILRMAVNNPEKYIEYKHVVSYVFEEIKCWAWWFIYYPPEGFLADQWELSEEEQKEELNLESFL